ncbi:TraB/GumN family protein [Sphingorhabdus sp. Alg239-R122]|uniref:TraB/GumN family protein n=1 Tax=Sphingorhabdus sp. Alg239-R122 TaxID=2305989 RepID=UPI0013DCFFAA|nr:TraB/GumN family protein [Sphingorhabdus sp. Alg239-R122]
MKKLLLNTALGALTLGIVSVASPTMNTALAQEAAAPAATEDTKTVDVDPALWVVKDEDTTIYMFGTVHFLRPGLSWFDEAVKTSFDQSDELVVEILSPDGPDAQQMVMQLATDTSGTSLRDKLESEDRAAYEAAMKKLGLPEQAFDQFKPWFASLNLGLLPALKSGYNPNSGADKILITKAKESGKKLSELETVAFQMNMLAGSNIEDQIKGLNYTVQNVDKAVPTIDGMVTAWSEGKPDDLAEIMNANILNGRMYDTFLTRRNAAWSRWIDERLDQPGTVFIAVGAGHLAGDGSVQEQLKLRGIDTARINY